MKTAAAAPLAPLTAGLLNDSPATYALGGGAALAVRFGMCEVAGLGLHHIAPNVHHEPATRTACVFTGACCKPRAPGRAPAWRTRALAAASYCLAMLKLAPGL